MEVYWTPDATWQEGQDDIAIAVAHYEGNETTAYGFAARKDGLITMDVSAFGSSFDVEHVYVYLCFARPPDGTDKQGQNSNTSLFFFPSAKAAPDAPETPATPAPVESA